MARTLFCFFLFACCCCCCCGGCCCFGLSPLFFALVLLVVALFCVFFGLKSSSSMLRTANRDGTAVAIFPSDSERKRTSWGSTRRRIVALPVSGRRLLRENCRIYGGESQRRRDELVDCLRLKPAIATGKRNARRRKIGRRCRTSTTYTDTPEASAATSAPRRGDQRRHAARRHRLANCAAMKNISARFRAIMKNDL